MSGDSFEQSARRWSNALSLLSIVLALAALIVPGVWIVGMARGDDGPAIDLSEGAPDSLIYGRNPSDMMPSSLTVVDLDDDGRDDVVLGAAFADGPENMRPDGGEAYVLSGEALEGEIDLRVDVDGVVFVYGAAIEEQLGVGLLWIDLNDNGRRELLLLASGGVGAPEGPGKLYLVELPGR